MLASAALITAMPCPRPLVLSLALALTSAAPLAVAQQDDASLRSAGRKLAQDGVALFQQGKADEASQKLEKAYQLLQVPSIALWSARALERRGLLVEASERYVEASRLHDFKGDRDVQLQAQADAARDLEKLLPRIPALVIKLASPAGGTPTVTLDGKPVPVALLDEEQPVNAGAHEIKVSLGAVQAVRSVTLKEGEHKTESIDLAGSESEPKQPSMASVPPPAHDVGGGAGSRRTLAFVALGAGGVGLLVGGVTGMLALSKRSALEDSSSCAGEVCLANEQSRVESLDTFRTVSTVGFVAGGVLAATGVVLLLTGKHEGERQAASSSVALRLTPNGAALVGAFQ